MKKFLLTTVLGAIVFCGASAQIRVSSKDAKKHINEMVTITDKVFSGQLITSSNMTMLYIGGHYPGQDLTIMIPGKDRNKFSGKPEVDYKGRYVIVTGKIVDNKGNPQLIVENPAQLKLVLADNPRRSAPKE